MTTVTFKPAALAVRAVAAADAVDATVEMSITPREATLLAGLLGATKGQAGMRLFNLLGALVDQGLIVAPCYPGVVVDADRI